MRGNPVRKLLILALPGILISSAPPAADNFNDFLIDVQPTNPEFSHDGRRTLPTAENPANPAPSGTGYETFLEDVQPTNPDYSFEQAGTAQPRYNEPRTSQPRYSESSGGSYNRQSFSYPPLVGPKKTIAVLSFDNRVTGVYGNAALGEGMTEMLISELFESGHFILVERSAMRDLVGEQALGQSGLVRAGSAASVGQMLGAQLLIKGVVSEFTYKQAGQGMGLSVSGFNIKSKNSDAHVGLDIRLIDANSGQIVDAQHIKSTASASGYNFGYSDRQDFQIGFGGFEKTPLGQATRQAMHEAVQYIIRRSGSVEWSGAIVKVDGSKVYINRGSNSNLRIGEQLVIYGKGEALIDPVSGMVLGADEERLGLLWLTDIREKYAIGRLQQDGYGAPPKRGDVVRLH